MTQQDPAAPPVLAVDDLAVGYQVGGRTVEAARGVSLQVERGRTLAVVGESGSGKTSTAQAVIGLLPENGRVLGGRIEINGTDISRWNSRRLQSVRGAVIGLVPQDPNNSLNPVKTVGANIAEVLRIHRRADRRAAHDRVVELLERVGIDDPERRARQYPHELSGGMRQRALIASAIALEPDLIIADEPTSALDVTVQRRVLDLLADLQREMGTAVLLITHDLAVATDRADEITVLKNGHVVEHGSTASVLAAPSHPYTRSLLADAPAFQAADASHRHATTALLDRAGVSADAGTGQAAPESVAVSVRNLVQEFALPRSGAFRAVDEVSFDVVQGTTHALVGESGSGKTTTARAVVGLQAPSSGSIHVLGQEVTALDRAGLRRFRRGTQLVYQNPFSSLDPRQSIASIVAEPLKNFAWGDRSERQRRVRETLERVALPAEAGRRRPAELSGGQRQRVAIARALVLDPQLLVLDEAVSALDVSVQAQILDLLGELQAELGLTYLFISHDLAVVRRISDTISVMRHGRVVEHGRTEKVFAAPEHDYTAALLDAVPGRIRQYA
ncbi:dipeptide ABC transporter ATP-binding protein [Bogoriella caseilytica]|uniref:Peptide/nickel transport system ATP-binding protein n=1 Tax=Bogoriella caseilytica TaxID=56055 RepID=A0A3N2B9E7_9MICO|nr:ABC transporter ATP-binding protein [Bogoriella caseilytica]ROR71895.1 peptide/nickel transport system ATP-binding protein [Bogoriella caseilytica]